MRLKGAAIQGALAIVGLSAAYATWQREPEKAPGEVLILDATKNDLGALRFEGNRGWVELLRDPGSDGTVWVRVGSRPDEKRPERELRGNEQAARVLDGFAPLKATRALGVVDEAKQKEFGLVQAPPAVVPDGGVAKPKIGEKKVEHITVTARGEKHSYTVGKPAGSFAPYLKDERDGKVYLLGGSIISDLESASSRMIDRTLHAFKPGEYDAIAITHPAVAGAAEKKHELIVLGIDQPTTAKLASKKNPEKPDDLARNWHEKLWKLVSVDVLGKGEVPASGAPQLALRLDYSYKGASKGYLELARVTPVAKAAEPGAATPPLVPSVELYGRSEHTAGWIKLTSSAEELIKEGEKLAASE